MSPIENAYRNGIHYIKEENVIAQTDGDIIVDISPLPPKQGTAGAFSVTVDNAYVFSNAMGNVSITVSFDRHIFVEKIELPSFFNIRTKALAVTIDGERIAPVSGVIVGKKCRDITVLISAPYCAHIEQSAPFVIYGQTNGESESHVHFDTNITMRDGCKAHITEMSGTVPLTIVSGKVAKGTNGHGHKKPAMPTQKTIRKNAAVVHSHKRYCIRQGKGKIMPDVPIARDAVKELLQREKKTGTPSNISDFVRKCEMLQYRDDHKLRTVFERRLPAVSSKQAANASKKMQSYVGRGADGTLVYIKAYLPLCFSDEEECNEYTRLFRKALISYTCLRIRKENVASDFDRDGFAVSIHVRRDCVCCVTFLKKGMSINDAVDNDNDKGYSNDDALSEVVSEINESLNIDAIED